MQQLGGLDAAFLALETSTVHAHVLGVSIYDPSTSPHRFDADHAKRLLLSKLDRIPAFRHRLMDVPGGFALPYWIDDPDFDIDLHVHENSVAAPGGRDELAAAIGEIHSVPLDRTRPLWTFHVLTGLADGHVAHVAKMHHAAVDGATGVAIMHLLNTSDPHDVELGEAAPWRAEPVPDAFAMIARGLASAARVPRRSLRLQRDLAGWIPKLLSARTDEPSLPKRRAPGLSFNRALTGRRSVALTSLDFPVVRAVAKATRSSVNDVVLAVATGALRTWLTDRGELPVGPVIAGVPIAIAGEQGSDGAVVNRLGAVLTALPVHLADPCEHLRSVSADMAVRKAGIGRAPDDLAGRAASVVPPLVADVVGAIAGSAAVGNAVQLPFNLGISNVPGPRHRLYCTGATLVGHYGVGLLPNGAALNITLNSYVDEFDVSIVGCPDLVEDLWPLADGLATALEALRVAVETE